MKFVLLGTGTLIPDSDRGPAGFLVASGDARILVDGGTGTLQRLRRHGVDARTLDAGVYSHRHIDHCGDLVPLLFALRVGIDVHRTRPYPIYAGAGFTEFLDQLYGVYGDWIRCDAFPTPVHEFRLDAPDGADLPGGVRLDTLPAKHGAGALHLKFTGPDGFTVVFSGDTGPNENLAKLAHRADVLVTECAGNPEHDHLGPDDVAAVVRDARPRRVVLTHFYPSVDERGALATVRAAGAPVERGVDGQVLALL